MGILPGGPGKGDRQAAEPLLPPFAHLGPGTGWPRSTTPSDLGPAPPRTETMVEKLLTNWLSICLYAFLKVRGAPGDTSSPHFTRGLLRAASRTWPQFSPGPRATRAWKGGRRGAEASPLGADTGLSRCLQEVAGEPLYMLLRAIQYQVDKGPVDAVTGKAKRTLNDSRLLREDVDFRPLTLMVLVGPRAGGAAGSGAAQRVPARVLDTDTITQVKEKVLDQVYKGTPFSQRPSVHALDLGERAHPPPVPTWACSHL